jgi:hypothetical protein
MSSLPEIELSQLPGSSAGESVDRQEEDGLGSPAAAAAAPLVSAPDTVDVDRSAPELSQLTSSSAGERVERQEESPAAAAVPAVSAPDTADRSTPELRQLAGSHTGESELTSEILEEDMIFSPVENNLFTRVLVLPSPMAVRYVYALLFALMTIVAWTVRDIELPRFNNQYGCDGSHDCIAANGVSRVSMGVAVSFFMPILLRFSFKCFVVNSVLLSQIIIE